MLSLWNQYNEPKHLLFILELYLMLFNAYYAHNYVGIIWVSLVTSTVCTYYINSYHSVDCIKYLIIISATIIKYLLSGG